MVRKTFIVGTGRCGTKYLCELLKANGIDAVWEPYKLLHPVMKDYYFGQLDGQRVALLREQLKKSWEFQDNDVIVDNGLSFCVDIITDLYPEASIVHLHRDGPPTIASHIRNGQATNWEYRWSALPWMDRPGSVTFNSACRWWSSINSMIIDSVEDTNVDYYRLPFDDLIKGRVSVLEEAIEANIEVTEIEPQNTTTEDREDNFPPPEEWSTGMRQRYNTRCRGTALQLGYDPMEVL